MVEFFSRFGINWKLLLAQAVNFGVLFFVLYRFAYHPVLDLLEKRRKKISEGIEMQKRARELLAATDVEKEGILKGAEQEAFHIVQKGEAAGKKRADELIRGAREKSEEIVSEGKSKLERERRILVESFAGEAGEIVRLAVAKVIEGSPEDLDSALIKNALAEVKKMKIKTG